MLIIIVIISTIVLSIFIRTIRLNQRGKIPWSQNDSFFDVFISYNTQSSLEARRIAEYLIANKVKVWFAEYMIPLNSQYNESHFRKQYIEGINKSKLCIVIKNQYYFASKYCLEEYEQINKTHDLQNIITVFVGDNSDECSLENGVLYDQSLKSIFEKLRNELGKKLILPKDYTNLFQCESIDCIHISHLFQFDITGWGVTKKDTIRLKVDKYDTVGPLLKQSFEGVQVNLQFSVGRDSQSSVRYLKDADFVDDRTFRKEMIEFANKYFSKKSRLKITGIHLLFLNEKSHCVYTYYQYCPVIK